MTDKEKVILYVKFIVSSISFKTGSLGMGEEKSLSLINEVFGFLLKALHPDVSSILLQELMDVSDTYNKEVKSKLEFTKTLEEITNNMKNQGD